MCDVYAPHQSPSYPMQRHSTIDRSHVIFMGGIIIALLAVVLLALAYVPL